MYSKKLIYDYFIGNDIEKETLEKLESDNSFLFEVLKASHDITYYSYLDISYRRSYDVIKYMLLNFKDKLDVYQSDVDYLLDSLDMESSEYKEWNSLIRILVGMVAGSLLGSLYFIFIKWKGFFSIGRIFISSR